jgi:cell division protein FtsW (lipid II flippase)
MTDFLVSAGLILIVAGIVLLAGLPWALIAAGIILVCVGVLSALSEGKHEPDEQTANTDSA